MEYYSNCEKDTISIAKKFSKKIKSPSIILLHGDLGAGKTHFTKGIAIGLKCKSLVTSPTFTIMNSYDGGKFPLYHFDMYRLKNADEAREAGLEEYLNMQTLKGVSVVEWAENVKGLIDENLAIHVILEKLGDEKRKIIIREEKC